MEYLGPDRESIGREKAGILRAGRPAIVSDPVPPQSVLDARRGDRRRPVALRAATSTIRATSSSGAGPGAAGATAALAYPALRGANQLLNAVGRAGRARGAARAAADHRAGGAQRAGDGRAAGALPDRAGPADAGARRRAQPACGGGAGGRTSTRWASTRARMRCSARWRDKDLAAMLARIGAADRPLVLHATCRRRAPRAAADLLARWQAQNTRARCARRARHADPMAGAARRRWPRRTPLIESSSSDRSTPWAAC